ncbi:MAG: efflux RND transporter permease subunit [Candidatus Melainabacteria bacterium]|nr:efflux RND transporter permease subunit [Candidatus Melainabacteria bacterium]
MWLLKLAMGRPVTIAVLVVTLVLAAVLSVRGMQIDIFPNLNIPIVYVVQPYGGLDPAQFEAYVVSHYENHFLYISGVDHIESKSIQNVSMMKVVFKPDTNMAEAMANIVAQVERSRAKMPPGTVTPFILRFDAGNVPVGYVVLSSKKRSVGDIEALADERIRPIITTISGATTTHPFGGNARTIVVTVNPQRMRALQLSTDDVVNQLTAGNLITPSGLVKSGDIQRIASLNSTVLNIQELAKIPLRGGNNAVLLGDIATIEDSMDIATGYALVNGRRTVFMTISKLSEASTVDVVKRVREALPTMKSVIPEDIEVSFNFDQSVYVSEAVNGLVFESAVGALLTGIMVLIFLRDIKSAIIVVVTIPIALAAALVGLRASGQTINIMTLGGLSLAVGVLVDEATVAIENIHTHLERRVHPFSAILNACREVITPQLLAVLSVVSVFLPSFLMEGTTKSLFVPLSLAVGFAMAASYVLANTLVPVLSGWLLKGHRDEEHLKNKHNSFNVKSQRFYARVLARLFRFRPLLMVGYLALTISLLVILVPVLKTEIFPAGNPSSFQLRMIGPAGTRVRKTEQYTKQVLHIVEETVGKENVDITICYVGTQPPNFGVSNVYIWTGGPQEAVILISLKHDAKIQLSGLREKLRKRFAQDLPNVRFSFESGDIINKIMNLGAPTPIQVDVTGSDLGKLERYSHRLLAGLKALPELRDVMIVQALEYPTIDITVDRIRAGQFDLTVSDVSKAIVPALYSSRFIKQIWWRDEHHGHSYQVQVQYPSAHLESLKDVEMIQLKTGGKTGPRLGDVAQVNYGKMVGEYDRYNMRRMISVTANISGDDLGKAARNVDAVIAGLGKPSRGMAVDIRGQVPILKNTISGLTNGLFLAIVAILLMLVAYFQRIKLAITVVSVIPGILAGAVLAIKLTDITLNIQSFMGTIMAVGIGIANAILIVSFSETRRQTGLSVTLSAVRGAAGRVRPVLMTSIAMVAGMAPMALGMAEGGERTAPLGIAVVGGLLSSLIAVLFILPIVFSILQKNVSLKTPSMLIEESAEEDTNEVKHKDASQERFEDSTR